MTATLLLADDSSTIQRVVELTFADEDVRVVVVSDGDEAIARIEAQPPDIVLADIGMPLKNGYEVASYVKHSPRLSHIPVLLLTGAFEPVDQQKADEAGCDGVLAKPFEPQLIISRVRDLLQRSRGSSAAAGPVNPPTVLVARPAPPAPVTPVARDAGSADTESLGDFFDRIDEAFTNLPDLPQRLTGREGTANANAGEAPAVGPRAVPAAAMNLDIGDIWDLELPATSDGDLPSFLAPSHDGGRRTAAAATSPDTAPASMAPPAPTAAPTAEPTAAPPAPPTVAPRSPSSLEPPRPAMPALADAFATLLAAEEPGAEAANTVAWMRPAVPAITDDLVEQVAQRVLARLSERVGATTADLVSSIAERLVREELDRIKAAIKNL